MVKISSWQNCLINWRSFIKVRSNLCKRFTKKFYHFRLGKVYIIWPCRSKPERLSTYNVIWTGCHVFFNHLLHEPLQPKRKDRMATIVCKRHDFTDTLILVLHYSIFQTVTQPRLSIHVHNCCVISPLSISCRRQNWFPAVLPMTCQITGQQGSVYISLVEWWQN